MAEPQVSRFALDGAQTPAPTGRGHFSEDTHPIVITYLRMSVLNSPPRVVTCTIVRDGDSPSLAKLLWTLFMLTILCGPGTAVGPRYVCVYSDDKYRAK